MIRATRLLLVAGVIVANLGSVAACSSSTAPGAPQPGSLAYFDSIYAANIFGGQSQQYFAEFVAINFEYPLAYGGSSGRIPVATAHGTEIWNGVAFAFITRYASDTVQADTEVDITLYSDNQLGNVVEGYTDASNRYAGAIYAHVTLPDSLTYFANSVASGSAAVTDLGTSCALQTGLHAEGILTNEPPVGACHSAVITASIAATFPAADSLGGYETVTVSDATFHGPVFQVNVTSQQRGPDVASGSTSRRRIVIRPGAEYTSVPIATPRSE